MSRVKQSFVCIDWGHNFDLNRTTLQRNRVSPSVSLDRSVGGSSHSLFGCAIPMLYGNLLDLNAFLQRRRVATAARAAAATRRRLTAEDARTGRTLRVMLSL